MGVKAALPLHVPAPWAVAENEHGSKRRVDDGRAARDWPSRRGPVTHHSGPADVIGGVLSALMCGNWGPGKASSRKGKGQVDKRRPAGLAG